MITHRDESYSEKMFARLNVFRQENIMIDLTIVVEVSRTLTQKVFKKKNSKKFSKKNSKSFQKK